MYHPMKSGLCLIWPQSASFSFCRSDIVYVFLTENVMEIISNENRNYPMTFVLKQVRWRYFIHLSKYWKLNMKEELI